ncbi:MAG: TetR/AcrR family transcriptional regulator [bacterium]
MQLAVPSPADQRSVEILGRARQAFVEKGFDGASMQDLARSAGMSVGNFYRYFPSKAAIIKAMIEIDLAEIQRDFAEIISSADPMATLHKVIALRIHDGHPQADGELWTEIQAAASRSPEIGAAAQQMETTVTTALVAIFAAETGLSEKEAHARFSASASFIMVMFKAASCLNCAKDVDQIELKSMIIRTIDKTLDDVVNSTQKA